MWSRRAALGILLGGVALGAAGCGWKPLYGTRYPTGQASGAPGIDKQLAAVRIEPIANRLGQQLHNQLRDGLNPLGQPASSTHRLYVTLSVRTYGALTRTDLSATRRNVEVTAFYKLVDSSGKPVLEDSSQTITGYDEFDDPLNDISANESAQERSTIQLAELIKVRLAAYFANPQMQPAPTAASAP
ncbi:MAG TPA: LPS assembly lipoprotein LptE [Dongiaceae bacterium]|nr:LPS assembly lipoprotein LptE [Dongiaceae bacterium]